MILRQALFGKFNLTNFRAIESATAFAKRRGNSHVELAHWIHQLLQFGDGNLQRICRHFKIDRQMLEHDVARALSTLPSGAASLSDFSHDIETAIERACREASERVGSVLCFIVVKRGILKDARQHLEVYRTLSRAVREARRTDGVVQAGRRVARAAGASLRS